MPSHVLSRSQADYLFKGITSEPPQRHDGRSLFSYRPIQAQVGFAAQANGSARIILGGTQVVCGIKAEVRSFGDDSDDEEQEQADLTQDDDTIPNNRKGGKVKCSIDGSPSLLHTFDSRHIESLNTSLSATISSLFSAKSSPIPLSQLVVIPNSKHWTIYIDILVISLAGGNLYDATFASIFAALYDAQVPQTRGVAFEAPLVDASVGAFENAKGDLDQMGIKGLVKSKSKTVKEATGNQAKVVDFELENTFDEGASLAGRENVPVCITVNILPKSYLLDATLEEEACIASRVHVIASAKGDVHAVKMEGRAEIGFDRISEAIKIGTLQAEELSKALQAKLQADACMLSDDDEDEQAKMDVDQQ